MQANLKEIAHILGNGKELKTDEGFVTLCPCHNDKNPSLSIGLKNDGTLLVNCHAGCSFEIVRDELKRRGLMPEKRKNNLPDFIWKQSKPDPEAINTYLDSRNIHLDKLPACLRLNRYKGNMILVTNLWQPGDGQEVSAVQRTFLDSNYHKTDRKMLGECKGRAAWLSLPAEKMLFGEGLETVLSAMQATGIPGVSCMSTNGLKSVSIPTNRVKEIIVLVDSDPNHAGQKAARQLATRFNGKISFAIPDSSCFTDNPRKLDFNDLTPEQIKERLLTENLVDPSDITDNSSKNDRPVGNQDSEPDSELSVPLPLVKKNEESLPFPFDALGPTMSAACLTIQAGVQAPDGIIAQSVLGAANLSIQGLRDIIIDGRVFPPSLFLLSIAATGERKSAVDQIVLYPHRELEREQIRKFTDDYSLFEITESAFENDKNAVIKDKKRSLEEKNAALQDLQKQAPAKPLDQTLLLTDFTFEGLFKLYQVGVPSKGLFADEGGQVAGGHGMKKESVLATAAGLSKFWDGARVDRIRVIDGHSHLYGRRLAVHIMMQEQVGLKFFADDVLCDQGLISRFLAAMPTTTVGTRKYSASNVAEAAAVQGFYAKVFTAMQMPLVFVEDSNEQELDPPTIALSPEAKSIWIELYDGIEGQSAVKQPLAPIRGLANKAAEHAARIACTIQLFECPDSTEIEAEAMMCGVKAIEWYLTEALRITGAFYPDSKLFRAKEVLRWIHENYQDGQAVPLPDIYRYSPCRSAGAARNVAETLVSHGHLLVENSKKGKPRESVETKDGAKSKEWWILHPDSRRYFNHD